MKLPTGQILFTARNQNIYPTTLTDKNDIEYQAFVLSEDELVEFANRIYRRGYYDCWNGHVADADDDLK